MADIYFASASAGGNTGANCANARAVSSHAIGDDVAGNTLHLCGTFTSGVGAGPILTMLASGSAGNPITVLFEPNALIQASVFSFNGGIFTNGKTDIVIDGAGTGSNSIGNFVANGKIQNTANGDQLANQGTIISGIGVTTLINAANCHRCTIKNLELANAYVASAQNAVVNTQNGATGGCTGNCVTRVSGTPFNVNWRTGISNAIKINNVNFTIASVQSANVLTVTAAPGTTTNQPFSWALGSDMTSMNAIVYNGQFTTVTNNKIHDCGWCLFTNYANNDTAYHVFGNDIFNYDHGQMFATAGANNCTNDPTLGCFNFHDNRLHDNINFETYANQPTLTNCTYHLDGVHFFGNGPGSPNSMDGIYCYNNYFYGAMSGPCSSGFFFMEADSSAQGANAKTCAFWNNVMDATGADVVWNSGNPNGWFGTFSCLTSNTVVSNTLLYNDILESANATNGFNISHTNSLIFKNNFSSAINMGNNIGNIGGSPLVDYNVYSGPPCHLSNNCLIFNGAFRVSFANWKSVSGFDTHSNGTIAAAATLINSDGSPQSGSPLIKQGDNLTSLATGKLATLAFDTTKGGSRTALTRPGGTCPSQGGAGCWDVGAYQFTAGGGSPILGFVPSPANFGTVNIGSSSNLTITVSNTGTASELITTITITGTNSGDFINLGTGTCVNGGTIGASLSCTVNVQFLPSALGSRTATLNVNGTVNASDTLNGTGATSLIALPAPGPGMFA